MEVVGGGGGGAVGGLWWARRVSGLLSLALINMTESFTFCSPLLVDPKAAVLLRQINSP